MTQDSEAPRHGGCLCGLIRYTLTGPPIYNVLCHCTTCRRLTGSAFTCASIQPASGFSITRGADNVKTFKSLETDTGTPLLRHFCKECGSQLFATTMLNERIVSVSAGGLDGFVSKDKDDKEDKGWWPDREQYCRGRPKWLGGIEEVERHGTHPLLEGMGKGEGNKVKDLA